MVFHWSLCDCKSPQVSRILLNDMSVLINAVVSKVFPSPPNFKSSSPFNNPLVTLLKAPITIGVIVTFMFHIFSIPLQGRWTYPSFHILSVLFCSQLGQQSRHFGKFSVLLLLLLLLGLVFWRRLSDQFVFQSPRVFYVCHFLSQIPGCAYTIRSYVHLDYPVVSSLTLFRC